MVLGKLLVALQDFLCDEHGHHAWRHIRAGVADEPLAMYCPYDDSCLYALLGNASELTGLSVDKLLEDFGFYFIEWAIRQGYAPQLRYLGSNLPELLTNLNNLHLHLSMRNPTMMPPNFKCVNVTPTSLELHYWSNRTGLHPLVIGLLRNLSKTMFEMDVLVTMVAGRQMTGDAYCDHDIFRVEYPYQAELHNWDNTEACERATFGLPPDLFFTLFPFHLLLDGDCRIMQVGSSLQRCVPEMGVGSKAADVFKIYHPYVAFEFDKIQSQLDNCFVLRVISTGMELKGQMVVAYHNKETGKTVSGREGGMDLMVRSANNSSGGRCPARNKSITNFIYSNFSTSSSTSANGARRSVEVASQPVLLFLGSPRLTNVGDLQKYQLHLPDLPLHDLNRDFVLLAEQRHTDAVLKEVHEKMMQELMLANQRLEEANKRIAALEETNRQLQAMRLRDAALVQDL